MQSFVAPHAVSVFVVHQNTYLLIRRCCDYLNGTWQMVSGKIEAQEKAWEAAYREVKEETSLVPDRLYSADAVETFYIKSTDQIAFVPVFVAFIDHQPEVVLAADEHDAYEWLPFETAVEKLAWLEQKRIMELVHKNFVLKEPSKLNRI